MGESYTVLFKWSTAEGFPQEYLITSSAPTPVPSPGEQVTVPGTMHNPPHPGEVTATFNVVARQFTYSPAALPDGTPTFSLLVLVLGPPA